MKLEQIVAFILLFGVGLILLTAVMVDKPDIYISSKYSNYCYPEGQEHFNIKKKIKFDTLEECEQYLLDKRYWNIR